MEDVEVKCYKKDYPRPQFVRNQWVNLNGKWDFGFDEQNCGEKKEWFRDFPGELEIQVPFTYETKLSGIEDESSHENIWYRRTLEIAPDMLHEKRLMLHFEGSDFITKVWLNGVPNHRWECSGPFLPRVG